MDKEIKLEVDNLALQVKYLAAMKGYTVTRLKELVNEKFGKTDSNRNLSNKFRTRTIRVSELNELLDILDYDIYIHEKQHKQI